MKKVAAFIFIALSFLPIHIMASTNTKALYVVMLHADWCGTCKVIAPQLEKAREKHNLDTKNVLFVTLDLTNDAARNQASIMASALGIEDIYSQKRGTTGFVMLVNSETRQVVGTITREDKADDIAAIINDKLAEI